MLSVYNKFMQKEMSEPVYKLTLYMSPSQWDNLSRWSASIESPWLYLLHEVNKNEEYAKLKDVSDKASKPSILNSDNCIYTTSKSTL